MRKLKCQHVAGMSVHDVLDEFNERAEEFNISESDIISISALPPVKGIKLATSTGVVDPKVEVVIFYWAEESA